MSRTSTLFTAGIVVIAAFLFYWYEWRPSRVRAECQTSSAKAAAVLLKSKAAVESNQYIRADMERAVEKGMFYVEDQERAYQNCLRANGLAQ